MYPFHNACVHDGCIRNACIHDAILGVEYLSKHWDTYICLVLTIVICRGRCPMLQICGLMVCQVPRVVVSLIKILLSFFLYFAVFPSNIRKYSTKKVQIYLAKDLCEDGRASAKGCCKPNRKQCSAPNSVFVFWQPAFNCIALLCSCVLQRERESRIEMRRWILPKVAKLPDDQDHDYHYPKSTMQRYCSPCPQRWGLRCQILGGSWPGRSRNCRCHRVGRGNT